MTPLIQHGTFTSHSGLQLPFKIECDALSDETLWNIAAVFADRLPRWQKAIGIPRGGLRLADHLNTYASLEPDDPILLADDVLTTGSSLREYRREYPDAIGAVIFARGPLPSWVYTLFMEAR